MQLRVLQQCPQCGGEVEVTETDRVLNCPFCGVRHILACDTPRFTLPHVNGPGRLLHVPYLRCKGSIFSCHLQGVEHRIVDTTLKALPLTILPATLGYRPQAMQMHYAPKELATTYLKSSISRTEAIARAAALHRTTSKGRLPLLQEWIGESVSLIYMPLFTDGNRVYDGVTGEPLATMPEDRDIFNDPDLQGTAWQLNLLPAICPHCGWDLRCRQESVVLLCANCDTAWQQAGDRLTGVEYETVPAKGDHAVHLPFWRLEVDFRGIAIQSLADFIRLTNIPRAIQPEWEQKTMTFYCPAFKIRPQIFLRIAAQLTSGQLPGSGECHIPAESVAVSLPAAEAGDSVKLILATAAVAKRNIMAKLPDISVAIRRHHLVFLPFFDNGYELCQEEIKVVINKQSLELGKNL